MTFGAMAAWQALLLIGAAAAAAAGLFLIKLRPPRVAVPSLLLWRRVLDESRELTLWERIRRAVSLVITILVAIALAVAITRPGRGAGSTFAAPGRTLVVIDSSWSMQARTRSGETRWDRAVGEARRLAGGASGGEVALATTAEGLIEGPTTDTTLIESALDRISPGAGDSGAWPRLAGTASVHFVTDGAVARRLDATVIIHSVHEEAPNVAVTALDVRPSLSQTHAGDGYVEIANFSPSAQKVRVTITRGAAKVFDRELDMNAAEVLRQVVPLARTGDPALRARVESPGNALDVDDEAVAWIDGARPLAIGIIGRNVEWLRSALARDPGVTVNAVDPSAYSRGDGDVQIFVGWAPPEPPARPALLFAPPPDTSWLGGSSQGPVENRPRWEIPGTHPVVLGVDPFTLSIERARAYTEPSLVAVARSVRGTPLVYVSESPERRFAVVTFGADESNLAGAPGFPVLIGNAIDWLTHPASAPRHRPGLMSFDQGVARVTGPGGGEVPLIRVNRTAVGLLQRPGFYQVEGGGARSTLAINAGDPQVSNLMRAPSIPSGQTMRVEGGSSSRPWWIYFAAAAFLLVLAEWWTWQRRITV